MLAILQIEPFVNCHLFIANCHIFTSPKLSCDAMLKLTGVNLVLMTDIDQYLFVEKRTRGDVSYISNRYAKQIINI